ncbi:uncharacterized protein LOC116194360 [Punica granatum]|uniref:DUF7792 domain-containing protein n=2 Tax=Punica granatum TaxID=22663 RepID=A0A218X6H7_PUNGR|nr:uncharacterized protein LOC116194360 [Punica granatum]OWM80388.1 hypothetical protein CDL15_Pgr019668 [Punica granatum]PKI52892.1 hypothetical protein CRG98_026723 [Punica granatum]
MADIVREILARPIQLADRLGKAAEDAHSFKQECAEIRAKADSLASLLRQVARASGDLYERPARRIADDAEVALRRALILVLKCQARNSLVRRVFTMMIPVAAVAFREALAQLENSVGDVSWLLRVSVSVSDRDDKDHLGLPPIASNEPILCLIWEQIAILHAGVPEDCSEAAATLVSLARDNDRYGKLIVEEGGVPPLLKLAKEGGAAKGLEYAARAIGVLGRAHENVERIMKAGVGPVFAQVLREGRHMKARAAVAWAISELATNHPKCREHLVQSNIVQLLVNHLAFETVREHHKYAVLKKTKVYSIHSVVMTNGDDNTGKNGNIASIHGEHGEKSPMTGPMARLVVLNGTPGHTDSVVKSSQYELLPYNHHHQQHITIVSGSVDEREFEDPVTKAEMKAMAALALCQLAKGNARICRMITESKGLLCFAVLLENAQGDVRSYSAQALMEITAVAEHHSELRHSAFKPTSPAAKAVVEQLMMVIEKADSDVLIPCIRAIGSLARTFRATETRIIGLLVKLLDGEDRDTRVKAEAAITLGKFACTANFLHVNHCQAIVASGGLRHLTQLVHTGDHPIQIPALVLLCYVAIHVPDSETLAQEDAFTVIEWSTKQAHLINDPAIKALLPKAQSQLELYQSRSSRRFH